MNNRSIIRARLDVGRSLRLSETPCRARPDVGRGPNDLFVTTTSLEFINQFKKLMALQFEMSDLGELTCYLGIEVLQENGCVKAEIDSIEKNNTWKLVPPPEDDKPTGLRWLYKLKEIRVDQLITRYKAYLMDKGYVQDQGIAFDEVFTLVARLEIIRLLIALAVRNE
uniref:Reverse transcriptase Ty1/copia-type domain-containing protein n=1 Tax=Lactuca sativa TaxID=4236 RepID=A0A9R1W772_LACSA|nr:hypothetical protein LSAT_V11C300120220 [Lactuca sativa]